MTEENNFVPPLSESYPPYFNIEPTPQNHYHYNMHNTYFAVDIRRTSVNWNEKIKDEDCVETDGQKTVRLKALQRMAREAGLQRSDVKVTNITDVACTKLCVQAIYTIEFADKSIWVGAADAHSKNTDGKFSHYLTAIAESRAEARALRKALGIEMLSTEEIGESVGQSKIEENTKIDPQQIKLLQSLLEKTNVQIPQLFEACLEKERLSEVALLEDLTFKEAAKCAKYLNEPRSSKTDRDKRKAELTKKVKESEE